MLVKFPRAVWPFTLWLETLVSGEACSFYCVFFTAPWVTSFKWWVSERWFIPKKDLIIVTSYSNQCYWFPASSHWSLELPHPLIFPNNSQAFWLYAWYALFCVSVLRCIWLSPEEHLGLGCSSLCRQIQAGIELARWIDWWRPQYSSKPLSQHIFCFTLLCRYCWQSLR